MSIDGKRNNDSEEVLCNERLDDDIDVDNNKDRDEDDNGRRNKS